MSYQYSFNKDQCWYKNVCNKFNTEDCYPGCIRYMEMHYLMFTSNIPLKMQLQHKLIPHKTDIKAFERLKDIKDNIKEFVESGENLYIYSPNTGNGKTTWSVKLMQTYFNKIWCGNGFNIRGIFVNVPTFLTTFKNVISKPDPDFEEYKENILIADLVIWDDISAVQMSNYDHTNLLTYVDQRVFKKLSNIYTGNLKEDNLRNALGERLFSRVWNDSEHILLNGPDRRGTN